MHAVSPELVLVDPELARIERARLVERAEIGARIDAQALRRAVERASLPIEETRSVSMADRWQVVRERRLVQHGLVLLSLAANGVVLALLVAGRSQESAAPPAPVAAPLSVAGIETGATTSPRVAAASTAVQLPHKSVVERRVLLGLVQTPRRELPSSFVDSITGLVRSNLRVVCRHRLGPRYICLVRVPGGAHPVWLDVRDRGASVPVVSRRKRPGRAE